MRDGLTPAWTVILVPPTPRASPRRVGVKMRTVRVLAMLAFAMLAAIRHKANTAAPPKSSLTMIRKSRR